MTLIIASTWSRVHNLRVWTTELLNLPQTSEAEIPAALFFSIFYTESMGERIEKAIELVFWMILEFKAYH